MWSVLSLLAAICVATAMVAPTPAAAVEVVTPPAFPTSTQMITVSSETVTDTTATLTAWERDEAGTWTAVIGPTEAYLGAEGIGIPRDNVWRTPMGVFALDQAFGNQPNPGTEMPYFQADDQDWWDALPGSPTYNTHVRAPQSPGGDSEHILSTGEIYDYVVNIAHNPQRVQGYASGIFLHVTNYEPTWGCVAIDRDTMRQIVQWLDPARQPVINIGLA